MNKSDELRRIFYFIKLTKYYSALTVCKPFLEGYCSFNFKRLRSLLMIYQSSTNVFFKKILENPSSSYDIPGGLRIEFKQDKYIILDRIKKTIFEFDSKSDAQDFSAIYYVIRECGVIK